MVADTFSDDAIARTAPQFLSNRLPVVTWKHQKSKAVLLRSASFVSHVTSKRKGILTSTKHTPDKPPELDASGIFSADVEAFISTIINACPGVEREADMSNSLSRDVTMPPTSLTFAAEDRLSQYGLTGKNIASQISLDSLDLELRGLKDYSNLDEFIINWDKTRSPVPQYVRTPSAEEEQPMTLAGNIDTMLHSDASASAYAPVSASLYPLTSIDADDENSIHLLDDAVAYNRTSSPTGARNNDLPDLGVDEIPPEESFMHMPSQPGDVIGRDIGSKKKRHNDHVSFASVPTNPRDWIVMDMLPEELSKWKTQELYIIGDKAILQNVPTDVYPSCTLIPVEVSRYRYMYIHIMYIVCATVFSCPGVCVCVTS